MNDLPAFAAKVRRWKPTSALPVIPRLRYLSLFVGIILAGAPGCVSSREERLATGSAEFIQSSSASCSAKFSSAITTVYAPPTTLGGKGSLIVLPAPAPKCKSSEAQPGSPL